VRRFLPAAGPRGFDPAHWEESGSRHETGRCGFLRPALRDRRSGLETGARLIPAATLT
jgi:hypothetical protein